MTLVELEPLRVTCEVIGMRKEFTVHNDKDMEYNDVFDVRPICTLFIKPIGEHDENLLNFSIQLDDYNAPCGSGYCMASWGSMIVESCSLNEVAPFTHLPKQKTTFDAIYSIEGGIIELKPLDDDPDDPYEWKNFGDVFQYSEDGGDEYYPHGGYSVNEDLFSPLPRFSGKRMVWIFVGESGVGKSTIAAQYPYGIYETDDYDNLPERFYDNVIVVGNRHHYDIMRDILPRIYQEDKPKLIITEFYQCNK